MSYYLAGEKKKSGVKQSVKVGFGKDKKGDCPPCPVCKEPSSWAKVKTPLMLLGGATVAYLIYLKFSKKRK